MHVLLPTNVSKLASLQVECDRTVPIMTAWVYVVGCNMYQIGRMEIIGFNCVHKLHPVNKNTPAPSLLRIIS